ncbi:MAG: hypothetical protein AAGK14_08810 [Verrucomicrobiota bacterium]
MNLERLAHSSEWLSPMIIKELRQGLHSKLFITFYLTLQGLLVLSALLMTTTPEYGSWLFWNTIGLTLLIALPARGLVAISLEIRAKTIELIYLTKLSSLRIVLGKWGALFLQALLCAVAVLPYLLVRYLLGGEEIIFEFAKLLVILLFSALCMAMTVSFSALENWWGRGAMVAIAFSTLGATLDFASPTINPGAWVPGILFLLTMGSLLTAISLYFGASLIATATDSHIAVLRVLCLAFCVVVPLAGLATENLLPAGLISMAVLLLVCLSSLLGRTEPISGNLRPFARLGILGRPAAMLLSPGWASGLIYTLFLFTLIALGLAVAYFLGADLMLFSALFCAVSLLGAILVPLALIMLFQGEDAPRLLPFIWVQISMLFATFFFNLMEDVLESGTGAVGPIDLLALMPTATLLLFLSPDQLAPDEFFRFFAANVAVTLVAACFLLYRAGPELRGLETLRQSFRQSLSALRSTATA